MRRKFEEFHSQDEVKLVQENNPKLKSLIFEVADQEPISMMRT